ncbi:MAG: hypothetical protein R3B09_14145 [Nannocystaceae bacterium]
MPRRRSPRLRRALAALSLVGLGLASIGCNEHPVTQVLVAPLVTGISVPIPPPSLRAEPVQRVDVEGLAKDVVPDTVVYLYELRSERGYFVPVDDDGAYVIPDVELDLTHNCLQLWYAEPGLDGTESAYGIFVLTIGEDDQSVEIDERGGCP